MPEPSRDATLKITPFDAQAAARRAEALQEAELVQLEALAEAIRPVVDSEPGAALLFDVAIDRGDRPRLFLDAVAFVEMGPDRRAYRFYQDMDYGCVLIAESYNLVTVAKALGNYIARRLAEAERAPAPPAPPAEPEPPPQETKPTAVALDLIRFFLTALGAVTLIGLIALAALFVFQHGVPT